MESDQIVAVEIEVVVWDADGARAIDQHHLDVPEDLDAYAVQQYVEGRFGRPAGTAHAPAAGPGDPVIGWTYPIATVPELEAEHPEATLLIVPFARFSDGSRRELLVHHSELRSRFAELTRLLEDDLPAGAPGATPTDDRRARLDDAPTEVHGRLEDEQLELYHADRAGITLEVGGWLRRMLVEGHTFVVIEIGDRHRYLQLVTHDGTWLRGEVVGPVYLPDHPLSDHELRTIRDIGWFDPEDGPGGGNFWMEWGDPDTGEPVDVDEAAEMAAATLCEAFGPVEPSFVTVLTGSSRPGELH